MLKELPGRILNAETVSYTDVMVETANLTESQTAQILDIVQRKTDVAPENIIITVSGVTNGESDTVSEEVSGEE